MEEVGGVREESIQDADEGRIRRMPQSRLREVFDICVRFVREYTVPRVGGVLKAIETRPRPHSRRLSDIKRCR